MSTHLGADKPLLAAHMPGPALPTAVAVPLFLLTPTALALWLVSQQGASWLPDSGMLSAALLAAVVLGFSPLPLSVPALLMSDARDWALNDMWSERRLRRWALCALRAILLVPYLMLSDRSVVRAQATAAVLGWALGLSVALPHLDLSWVASTLTW